MRTVNAGVPDLVPILSRGKHRNARKGACFMELASYLAGERWSDHPRCTHPLLGSVCRLVNDLTSDEHRARLAALIPCVIGMTSDDPRVDARIALRCARAALPIAAAEDQNVMAVAVLAAERALAELEDRPAGSLEDASRAALASAIEEAGDVGGVDRDAAQRIRGSRHPEPGGLEALDDAVPARRVGEGAVDEDDGDRGV